MQIKPKQKIKTLILRSMEILKIKKKLHLIIFELIRWNKKVNLTGYQDKKNIFSYLMLDSIILAKFLKGICALDIGSGAGFPGIILSLMKPNLEIFLLDARNKRTEFIKYITHSIKITKQIKIINFHVLPNREIDHNLLKNLYFDNISLKAVSTLKKSILLGKAYVRKSGYILLPRGLSDHVKISNHGYNFKSYRLSSSEINRTLVIYK